MTEAIVTSKRNTPMSERRIEDLGIGSYRNISSSFYHHRRWKIQHANPKLHWNRKRCLLKAKNIIKKYLLEPSQISLVPNKTGMKCDTVIIIAGISRKFAYRWKGVLRHVKHRHQRMLRIPRILRLRNGGGVWKMKTKKVSHISNEKETIEIYGTHNEE